MTDEKLREIVKGQGYVLYSDFHLEAFLSCMKAAIEAVSEEPKVTVEIRSSVNLDKEEIYISEIHSIDELNDSVRNEIYRIKDKGVKEGLIKLGWIPPEAPNDA